MRNLYQIVMENEIYYTDDIYDWCARKGLTHQPLSDRRRYVLRLELQDSPKIDNLYGPMWGGEHDERPMIRYEDEATYTQLSA